MTAHSTSLKPNTANQAAYYTGAGFTLPHCPYHPHVGVVERLGHVECPICRRVTESCCEGAPMG